MERQGLAVCRKSMPVAIEHAHIKSAKNMLSRPTLIQVLFRYQTLWSPDTIHVHSCCKEPLFYI